MSNAQFAGALREIGRLFRVGSAAGLSEGQLLERFVSRRDDAAFEAIVARHGPMVLAVCRSLLRDPNDVDDAFQATFLVLVRKAESLRDRDRLGGWLHAVANRVARRARFAADQRRRRDSRLVPLGPPGGDEPERHDLRAAVHAEIDRLPESYRLVVLLCDLQGRTNEEAAGELGWPVGTVKGRLHRARGLLRERLARRGLAPTSAALVGLMIEEGRAAIAPALMASTARVASAVAADPFAIAGAVPARVLELTQGALMTMPTTKIKLAATTLLVAALAGPGASAFQGVGGGVPPAITARPQGEAAGTPPASDATQARIKLAEKAVANIEQKIKEGASPRIYDKLFLWQQRLAEARIDSGVPEAEAMKPYLDAIKSAEKVLKSDADGGHILQADADEAEFRRLDAQARLDAGTAGTRQAGVPGAGGMMAGMMRGGAAMGGGGFGGIGGGAIEEEPRRKPRPQHPADLGRNKAIEERLEKEVPMKFASETPLEDVLKYVKESTKEKEKSVPIYVDPIALQDSEKTMQSTVKLDLEDVPLRTTLRLLLEQLDLDYRVRDGMIFISSPNRFADEERDAPQDPPSTTVAIEVPAP